MSEGTKRKGGWFVPLIVSFGLVAGLFVMPFGVGVRSFRNPSGSMQPALFPGDYFIVTKWTYGYGRYSFAPFPGPSAHVLGRAPQLGEIAVFRPAPEPDRDFVKRVIGVPGDRIQMIDGVLHINGAAVQLEPLGAVSSHDEYGGPIDAQAYRETLPNGVSYVIWDRNPDGELDNTRVYVVPNGSYFVMGDDRDNSADSRVPSVVGYVPLDNFVGPVWRVISTSPARPAE
jgi:signal peptidase I